MAYLVTDGNGRREFRWLDGRLRRSRRIPHGERGDILLSGLRAARQAEAEVREARRAEVGSAIMEADAMRRELGALDSLVRASLNGVLEPPLTYDHVHGTIVRTDRMGTAKIKAAAESKPKPKRVGWAGEGQPAGMDPTFALRARLASKFWPEDVGRQMKFCQNLQEIEAELLDGDESPAARMLAGNLVLTWAHGLWADNELLWETHRVGVVPAATVAMTRRAESLSNRFQSALRLWESYCRRTRGEAPTFPTQAANRVSPFFVGTN